MALFAAYADANEENNETADKHDWLSLSSYKIDATPTIVKNQSKRSKTVLNEDISSDSSYEYKHKHKKKKKPKKVKKTKFKKAPTPPNEENFVIDRKRNPEYLTVTKIHRPMAPKYHVKTYFFTKQRKRKMKRYFHCVLEKPNESNSEEEKITKSDLKKQIDIQEDTIFLGFRDEEELTKMTAYYNKSLAEEPNNIEMWIKYCDYQDMVFQFEKTYRKGSIAKGLRVTATRKLSILDKALTHNPESEKLLRLRLNIAVNAYPADELKEQLRKLVEKEKGNIILWQGYIEATQCSMSHCNTPAVLYLYIHCLETLHTLRRTSKLEKAQLEENILRILFQCGLFLRQAGLFEQLYTLLRDYLELNAAAKINSLNVHDENKLVELEDIVLHSQLPRHEIWLRVEKLREASHWLPHEKTWCDEAERIFFSDVRNLIHPITIQENVFKLTITMLTLIKVPLLPCRHTAMQEFGIDYVPWALDSIETLLSVFLPIFPIDLCSKSFLQYSQKLAVGPQYLKTFPGQEEYLQFVLSVLKSCMDSLPQREKIAISIWWFRFQRLLTILEREQQFKVTGKFKDNLKNEIKNVLKNDPTNIILFREYALLEYDSGRFNKAIGALKTAISLNSHNKPLFAISDLNERAAICSTFRILIELHLYEKEKHKTDCLKYFVNFILGKDINHLPETLTAAELQETKKKLQEFTDALITNLSEAKITGTDYFLPILTIEWIICNGWFLYLHESLQSSMALIENVLKLLNEISDEKSLYKEMLLEFLVGILYKECVEQPGSGLFPKLDISLHEAIASYPNNLFFLSVLMKLQSLHHSHGQSWWKFKSLLMKSGHVLPSLFLILIANERILDAEKYCIDSLTGLEIIRDNGFKNNMLSLFRRLTTGDMCTRRCGLLWRLYLQFLHTYFDPQICRNAYYVAVEECPWLKALYIDAAIYVPEDLPKIQGLITEKQLRIHIHPQELEVFLDEQIT